MARNNRDVAAAVVVACGDVAAVAARRGLVFVGFDSKNADCCLGSNRLHSLLFVEFPARVGHCALLRFAALAATAAAAGDGDDDGSAPQSHVVLQFG